ncbi:hypothetical protein Tco_0324836 [Tanacetum coccineum]
MDDDFKSAVQHQRRVNLKIHDVIKKEVIKLLDAGLIYPISDNLWVSYGHVCIDYRKLNDATRKDHFSLPFMDQMLEHGAGEVGWGAAAVSWRAEWWEGGGGGWVWGVAVDDWLMGWMAVSGVGELQWAACEDWAAETVEGRLWRGVACWGTWGVEQAELHCWLLADCWSLLVRGSGLLIGWRRETGRGMGLMCLLLAAGGGGWLLAGRSCDWLGWAGWWEGVPDWCVGLCGLWLELRVAGLSLHIAGSGCGRGCEGGVWEAAVLISCGGRGVWVGGLTVDLAAGRLGRAGRLLVWGGWTSGRAEESAETGLRLWTGSWPGMV